MQSQAVRVFDVSIDYDLSLFSRYLWQQNIPHRIYEEADKQVLWVAMPEHKELVLDAFEKLRSGEMRITETPGSAPRMPSTGATVLGRLFQVPVTALLIVGSLLGFLIVEMGMHLPLLFQDFTARDVAPGGLNGEFWRMITPIFLHFGLLHLVFNSLWIWEFGRRIEILQGGFKLLGIVFLVGLGSNIIQYLWQTDAPFGGMSGVIYGMVGYCFIWQKLRPSESFGIPPQLMYFLIGWMVICMTGVLGVVGVLVANAAHVGGFVMGLILGAGGVWLKPPQPQG